MYELGYFLVITLYAVVLGGFLYRKYRSWKARAVRLANAGQALAADMGEALEQLQYAKGCLDCFTRRANDMHRRAQEAEARAGAFERKAALEAAARRRSDERFRKCCADADKFCGLYERESALRQQERRLLLSLGAHLMAHGLEMSFAGYPKSLIEEVFGAGQVGFAEEPPAPVTKPDHGKVSCQAQDFQAEPNLVPPMQQPMLMQNMCRLDPAKAPICLPDGRHTGAGYLAK